MRVKENRWAKSNGLVETLTIKSNVVTNNIESRERSTRVSPYEVLALAAFILVSAFLTISFSALGIFYYSQESGEPSREAVSGQNRS